MHFLLFKKIESQFTYALCTPVNGALYYARKAIELPHSVDYLSLGKKYAANFQTRFKNFSRVCLLNCENARLCRDATRE